MDLVQFAEETKLDLGTMGSGAAKIKLQTTNISKTGDLTFIRKHMGRGN